MVGYKEDSGKKLLLALKISLPITVFTLFLAYFTLIQDYSVFFKSFILTFAILFSVYFTFFMLNRVKKSDEIENKDINIPKKSEVDAAQKVVRDSKIRKKDSKEFDRYVERLIEEGNFFLLFQPILNVNKKQFDMVEILVKLIDDSKMVHPSEFIPAVNRLGIENKFDMALTKKLLEIIKEHNFPKDIYYSLNIFPRSIRDKGFSELFCQLFDRFSLSKDIFIIELYENTLYKDVKFYSRILNSYKDMGFKLAFDNFNACNSSIDYIKSLNLDFIHFDKFFTKSVEDERFYLILKSWIEFLKSLKIKPIVKFIDTQEKKDIFLSFKVDYIQGYEIAKPMDVAEFNQFLKEKL